MILVAFSLLSNINASFKQQWRISPIPVDQIICTTSASIGVCKGVSRSLASVFFPLVRCRTILKDLNHARGRNSKYIQERGRHRSVAENLTRNSRVYHDSQFWQNSSPGRQGYSGALTWTYEVAASITAIILAIDIIVNSPPKLLCCLYVLALLAFAGTKSRRRYVAA